MNVRPRVLSGDWMDGVRTEGYLRCRSFHSSIDRVHYIFRISTGNKGTCRPVSWHIGNASSLPRSMFLKIVSIWVLAIGRSSFSLAFLSALMTSSGRVVTADLIMFTIVPSIPSAPFISSSVRNEMDTDLNKSCSVRSVPHRPWSDGLDPFYEPGSNLRSDQAGSLQMRSMAILVMAIFWVRSMIAALIPFRCREWSIEEGHGPRPGLIFSETWSSLFILE